METLTEFDKDSKTIIIHKLTKGQEIGSYLKKNREGYIQHTYHIGDGDWDIQLHLKEKDKEDIMGVIKQPFMTSEHKMLTTTICSCAIVLCILLMHATGCTEAQELAKKAEAEVQRAQLETFQKLIESLPKTTK